METVGAERKIFEWEVNVEVGRKLLEGDCWGWTKRRLLVMMKRW